MSKNKIKIIVGGHTATGKSTIAELISIALKKEGFNVEITNPDGIDDEMKTREYLDIALPNILNKTNVIEIEEVQLNRLPKQNEKYKGLNRIFNAARLIADEKYYKPKFE